MIKLEKIRVQAVIFDMDGTLFDTEALGHTIWRKASEQLNAPFTDEFFERIIGVNQASSRALAFSLFGEDCRYDEVNEYKNKLWAEEVEKNGVPEKKGMRDLLRYLKDSGIPMAIATSTREVSAKRNLKRAGIYEYFTAEAFGDQVQKGKPDPEIFLLAARRLGVPIEKCAVFEDSLNGLKAAKKAGAIVFGVPDLKPIEGELAEFADYVVPSLDVAMDYLQKEQL